MSGWKGAFYDAIAFGAAGGGVVQWLSRWSQSTKLLYIGPGYCLDGWQAA